MATYTHREIVSRRVEYIVPAAEPWGADAGEIGKAVAAASAKFREMRGLPAETVLMDDVLRFRCRDDEIVISFTIEEYQ